MVSSNRYHGWPRFLNPHPAAAGKPRRAGWAGRNVAGTAKCGNRPAQPALPDLSWQSHTGS